MTVDTPSTGAVLSSSHHAPPGGGEIGHAPTSGDWQPEIDPEVVVRNRKGNVLTAVRKPDPLRSLTRPSSSRNNLLPRARFGGRACQYILMHYMRMTSKNASNTFDARIRG